MTFATLYFDEGSLLNFHDDRGAACANVLSVVEQHPEVAEDFGMIELDEHGLRVGDVVSGADMMAQAALAGGASGAHQSRGGLDGASQGCSVQCFHSSHSSGRW
jgi:hypothetical protein